MENALIHFIDKLPEMILALAALAGAYFAYKAKNQSQANEKKIDNMHDAVNGINADRLSEAKIASRAEGVIEGHDKGVSDEKERNPAK